MPYPILSSSYLGSILLSSRLPRSDNSPILTLPVTTWTEDPRTIEYLFREPKRSVSQPTENHRIGPVALWIVKSLTAGHYLDHSGTS